MCGSDPVHEYEINSFIEQGATFIANWGMTEIGPVAINKTYKPGDVAENYKEYTILGDTFHCDYKIVDSELHVKGAICVYPEWFATGDLVHEESGTLYYIGRKD
jgi:long-subunit acyl-CoA synthetase (AMP-forming)